MINNIHRYFINSFSTETVVLAVALAVMALACGIFYVTKKIFSNSIKDHKVQLNQSVMGVGGAASAFLAGFMIVVLWQMMGQAEVASKNEAEKLSGIIRDARALQQTAQLKIIGIVADYTKSVREEEWLAMREGGFIKRNDERLDELYRFLLTYEPHTEREKIFYLGIMGDVKNVINSRLQRLNYLGASVSNFFIGIILVTSMLLLALASFMECPRSQQIVIVFLSIILSFNISVITLLDYPFSGSLAVSNKYFYRGELAQFK